MEAIGSLQDPWKYKTRDKIIPHVRNSYPPFSPDVPILSGLHDRTSPKPGHRQLVQGRRKPPCHAQKCVAMRLGFWAP